MLEVSEAVAQHWLDVRWHYVAVVMGYTTAAVLMAGFVVGAQTERGVAHSCSCKSSEIQT